MNSLLPPSEAVATPRDPVALRRQAAGSIRHPLSRTLLLLTFSTGFVDAASFLGLGHVFTANMTGNVVLLGFGFAGAAGLPVLAPLVSLLAFVLGSGAGGRIAVRLAGDQDRNLSIALTIETGLILAASATVAAADVRPGGALADVVIALLAFALGVRNATVRKVAVPDLTTTVLTMTLTGLAADSRLSGGSGAGSVRRGAAVVSMLAGAVCGALLLRAALWAVLLAAAALALVTLILYRAAMPPGAPTVAAPSAGRQD